MKVKVVIIAVCALLALGTAGVFAGNAVLGIMSEKNTDVQA